MTIGWLAETRTTALSRIFGVGDSEVYGSAGCALELKTLVGHGLAASVTIFSWSPSWGFRYVVSTSVPTYGTCRGFCKTNRVVLGHFNGLSRRNQSTGEH